MKIKIDIVAVVSFILLLIMNEPAFIGTIAPIHSVFVMFRDLIRLFFLGIMALNVKLLLKGSKVFWIIAIFHVLIVVSTFANSGALVTSVKHIIPIIIGCFIVDKLSPQHFFSWLKGTSLVYTTLTLINVASVILVPSGLYNGNALSTAEKYFFLGHNNATIRIMISAIIYTGIYDYLVKNRLSFRSYLLIFSVFLSVVLTWSNTAMIGSGIFIMYLIFIDSSKKAAWGIYDARLFLGISVFMFLFFVVFQSSFNVVSVLVQDVFNKDLTFSGRTILWENSMEAIKSRPLLGFGYGRNFWEVANITWFKPVSAHNIYLDILLRGGYISLGCMFLLLITITTRLRDKKNKMVIFISIALLSYYIMWTYEPFLSTGVLGMFLFFQTIDRVNSDDIKKWRTSVYE